MSRKTLAKGLAVLAAIALSAGMTVTPASATTEILVWADESRGPNLQKTIAAKGDWVAGYTVKVVAFSSFDALKTALDNATALTGPDIVVGANDWVPTGAKNGKLAPLTLSAAVKARFTANNLFDLSYRGKLYGIPVDVNNVAMIYNTKLVSTAPKTFGDMVNFYLANKTSKGLVAGLCVAGGGMSWGAHSVFSALGANAYTLKNGVVQPRANSVSIATFSSNVKKYLLSGKKSNGFFPATDTGCKDNFLAGKVPFAIIGNWEWTDYTAKGFAMNAMPVPGVSSGTYGHMFGSVSGALLTTYAALRGVDAGAKSLLTDFFGSTAGQVAYQAFEKRPPAEKGAQSAAGVTDGQKAFGAAAALAGIPQIGAFLNNNSGGANYWDSAPAFWTAVLVKGLPVTGQANKLGTMWKANIAGGLKDL